jgi:hypothetical protein
MVAATTVIREGSIDEALGAKPRSSNSRNPPQVVASASNSSRTDQYQDKRHDPPVGRVRRC